MGISSNPSRCILALTNKGSRLFILILLIDASAIAHELEALVATTNIAKLNSNDRMRM